MSDANDEIERSEICPSCGEIPLDGEVGDEVECPNCGAVYLIVE